MGKDEIFRKKREQNFKRKSDFLFQRAEKILIVTEGIKTEPYYFAEIEKDYNRKYPNLNLKFDINGEGKNTKSLVKKAIELEQEVDFYTAKTIPFAKVFVVFDKDSFNDDQFNEAINMCNRNGYVALWSNQAIEYWFLLHFGKVDCKMDRRDYEKKINKQYKHNEKYLKNDSNTYHYINKYGNVNNAIKHAKSIHKFFLENEITPAKSESCTTVYKIFEYLKELIDVKQL